LRVVLPACPRIEHLKAGTLVEATVEATKRAKGKKRRAWVTSLPGPTEPRNGRFCSASGSERDEDDEDEVGFDVLRLLCGCGGWDR